MGFMGYGIFHNRTEEPISDEDLVPKFSGSRNTMVRVVN